MEKICVGIDPLTRHRQMLSSIFSHMRRCRKSNISIRLTHVASETGSELRR
jgi:hypothetical protein